MNYYKNRQYNCIKQTPSSEFKVLSPDMVSNIPYKMHMLIFSWDPKKMRKAGRLILFNKSMKVKPEYRQMSLFFTRAHPQIYYYRHCRKQHSLAFQVAKVLIQVVSFHRLSFSRTEIVTDHGIDFFSCEN